jgi:hypothetical protein
MIAITIVSTQGVARIENGGLECPITLLIIIKAIPETIASSSLFFWFMPLMDF